MPQEIVNRGYRSFGGGLAGQWDLRVTIIGHGKR